MQTHRPGTRFTHRLAHRDIKVPHQSRINRGLCHDLPRRHVAPFLWIQSRNKQPLTVDLEAGLVGDKIGAAHRRHLDKAELVICQCTTIAWRHLEIVLL